MAIIEKKPIPKKIQPEKPNQNDKPLTRKQKLKKALPVIFILAGISILVAILLFGLYSKQQQSQTINTYLSNTTKKDNTQKIDAELKKAIEYNKTITKSLTTNTAVEGDYSKEYTNIFPGNNGIFGVLVIDKISLKLPIYHGTSDEALQQGVGHVQASAFPIGTKGTKSILTGHNGVPGADMLFTRLDEMKKGNTFYVRIGQYEYHYKVTKIQDITPDAAEEYAQEQNNSTADGETTLITCYPYGVNTRRLLVTGKFTKRTKTKTMSIKQKTSMGLETKTILIIIAIGLIILIVIFLVQRHQNKSLKQLERDLHVT